MKSRITLAAVLACFCSHAAAGDAQTLSYNGNDLDGWTTTGNWIPQKQGVLALQPRDGEEGWKRYDAYLWAEKTYGDFVCEFEYKHGPEGNSGLYFHVKDKTNPVETGIEVQIRDSFNDSERLTPHHCGGVVGTQAPTKNMSKPPGEWNRMIVTCRGNHLQVELNGESIIDLQLDETRLKDRPNSGFLGLQDHGQKFWVRNLQVREL